MTPSCAICQAPLSPDSPSQIRCARHLNTPTPAEAEAIRRHNADRAALFASIRAKHNI